ncbi:MAG: putative DNA binding domain-containing protein [Fibrobacter sp.]|nr:putative DNA binding domain-containing protein [Fibrobacter sp.]
MPESQNVEYKSSWRDEYLKWICGFANAQGGKLYIGIDDGGNVCGVADSKRLMEDIPNKVRDALGLFVEVNLLSEDSKEYIEISVSASSEPINYKGEYHYRTGSTKQLLQGPALTHFLLNKTKTKWDAVPVDGIEFKDLDKESFDIFRREAKKSGRMTAQDLAMTNEELLDSLNLTLNGKLTRAAVLLFHRKPERWFGGAYVKIGFFGDGPDLQYQDEVYGSLFIQADRVVELIYLKYFKAHISYDGLIRVERYPIPKDAMREAVFNALMHSNYDSGVPIQIRIHENLVLISNDCIFPANWTAETLMQRHRSEQYNPKIANAFFRAGYVEAWGRGIENMCKLCAGNAVKTEYTVHPCDVMLEFSIPELEVPERRPEWVTERVTEKVTENQSIIIREIGKDPFVTAARLAEVLGISLRKTKENIRKLQKKGFIRRVGPDKGGYWEIISRGT